MVLKMCTWWERVSEEGNVFTSCSEVQMLHPTADMSFGASASCGKPPQICCSVQALSQFAWFVLCSCQLHLVTCNYCIARDNR